ncbi:MAG: glycoside hydrolase family 97 N-terminal domain-containing protein, partial [Duganella sp.]
MHTVRHHSVLLIMLAGFTGLAQADTISVRSPDGRNVISIDSDKLSYAVQRDGQPLIVSSPLGLQLNTGTLNGTISGALKAGARLTGRETTSVRDTYDIVLGKARSAPDHYQQT